MFNTKKFFGEGDGNSNISQVGYRLSIGPFNFQKIMEWFNLLFKQVLVIKGFGNRSYLRSCVKGAVKLFALDCNLTCTSCAY